MAKLIIGFQIAIYGLGFLLLIYLLIKRLKAKKLEDFEDRDN